MGYISMIAWSVSFYFMAYEVIKVKNSDGFSINYLMLNFLGYTYYSTYNVYGYKYNASYNSSGQLHISDCIFAIHGLFMTSVHIVLVLYYPRTTNRVKIIWLGFAVMSIMALGIYAIIDQKVESIVKLMGLMKVAISFVKYVPQVYLNCIRRTTLSWSTTNVFLDLTGGLLSFLQIIIDYIDKGKSTQFSSNLNTAKFLLGIVTVVFDIIFLFQRFVLFPPKKPRVLNNTTGEETIDADDYKKMNSEGNE